MKADLQQQVFYCENNYTTIGKIKHVVNSARQLQCTVYKVYI